MLIKKKYKVVGMHCTSCALTIEWGLEDIGVKAKCQYATEDLEVEYDQDKIPQEKIFSAVEGTGYKIIATD